jgi:hypothetical protein
MRANNYVPLIYCVENWREASGEKFSTVLARVLVWAGAGDLGVEPMTNGAGASISIFYMREQLGGFLRRPSADMQAFMSRLHAAARAAEDRPLEENFHGAEQLFDLLDGAMLRVANVVDFCARRSVRPPKSLDDGQPPKLRERLQAMRGKRDNLDAPPPYRRPKGADNPAPGAETPIGVSVKKSNRGRRKNSGSMKEMDKPILRQMRTLIQNGECDSAWQAAKKLAPSAAGSREELSRVKRLHKRYKAWEQQHFSEQE